MTGFDDDRELDDFLAHRSALHRRFADRDGSEPPPELDRLVLNKAREAIDVPAPAPMYRAPRWALPVALAASVVLALAVVMNFARVQHRAAYPAAASASPAAEAAPALADTQSLPTAPTAGAPERELAKQSVRSFAAEPSTDALAGPSSRAANSGALVADARAQSPAASGAAADAADAASPGHADRARDGLLAANTAISAPLAAAPEPAPPPATAALAKPHSSIGAVQMPAEVKAASDASGVTGAARAGSGDSSQPANAAAANNTARFARAEVATEGRIVPAREIALAKQEADSSAMTAARREGSGSTAMNAATSAATDAYAPAPSARAAIDKAKRADPQAWMREIERLRTAGKTADADRELAEFRKAFPNETVPRAAAGRDPRPAK
jgi:hypothetical protein